MRSLAGWSKVKGLPYAVMTFFLLGNKGTHDVEILVTFYNRETSDGCNNNF
jgi:hypothetical protein